MNQHDSIDEVKELPQDEVKEPPIDPRFQQWESAPDGSIAHVQSGKWLNRLNKLKCEYGQHNMQLYVLNKLPITPQQKIDVSQEFFPNTKN
jgi:hypothetical protein